MRLENGTEYECNDDGFRHQSRFIISVVARVGKNNRFKAINMGLNLAAALNGGPFGDS